MPRKNGRLVLCFSGLFLSSLTKQLKVYPYSYDSRKCINIIFLIILIISDYGQGKRTKLSSQFFQILNVVSRIKPAFLRLSLSGCSLMICKASFLIVERFSAACPFPALQASSLNVTSKYRYN
ncbi:hypothetical protein Barb6XT_03159 [Bacteroidales bacterium Barb6XT]|nr:hypothetical protein Barb6XT_03159 [Bacteroidales bacterium Barb6XT]